MHLLSCSTNRLCAGFVCLSKFLSQFDLTEFLAKNQKSNIFAGVLCFMPVLFYNGITVNIERERARACVCFRVLKFSLFEFNKQI